MFEELKKYEPIYIIGHKKPDVDSVIASVLLNNIFKSKGIESYPCFLDSEYNIDEYNAGVLKDCVSLDNILIKENSDSCNYVLVDHNDPIQSVGFGKRIVSSSRYFLDYRNEKVTNKMNKGRLNLEKEYGK